MKYRYLPATVMLSAGAVTIFICMYNRYDTLYSLKIFLIIGSLSRRALIKIMDMGKSEAGDVNITTKAVEEENLKDAADSEDGDLNS